MGWKEFAASVVGSVAWPVVVLVVVLLLLGPLRRLIGRIRTWKAFGVEAELNEDLQATRQLVRAAAREEVETDGLPVQAESTVESEIGGEVESLRMDDERRLREKLYHLASGFTGDDWESEFVRPHSGDFPSIERTIAAPVVGIRESWDALGNFLSSAARKHRGGRAASSPSLPALLDELRAADLVSDLFAQAVLALWKIRNEVISGDVSPGAQQAVEFRQNARSLHLLAQKLLYTEGDV